MRIAIAGAGGFIGARLARALASAGHDVVAIGRTPERLPAGDGIERVAVDVGDEATLREALGASDAAYYLIHSMSGGEGFADRDRALAATFARAASAAGIARIVYLGALGAGDLSTHLSSRQEVGDELRATGIDVVELRAAVVLGAGSVSFEMLRYLVERLPAMVCPRWVRTRIHPIALGDVLAYLERALKVPPGIYEIGVERATSYREMMDLYASVRGLRRRVILDVPLLTLKLSSYWVDLVTPVDRRVSHSLIGSLSSEVLVRDRAATDVAFGIAPMPLEAAMRAALDDQVAEVSGDLLERSSGLRDGVYALVADVPLSRDVRRVRGDLAQVGGDLAWYGLAPAWRLRMLLGRLLGERMRLRRPERLEAGARVDWWVAERVADGELVLRTAAWFSGEAWLAYRLDSETETLRHAAALRPRGVPGLLYWWLLSPIHFAVFRAMARRRAKGAL